jgi:hypothetical protein
LGELAAEVRAFIDRRDELASKLSQEIELTEKKLAELKRTAALLFPANGANGHAEKDRPERKSKKVNVSKAAGSAPETAPHHEPHPHEPAVHTPPPASDAPTSHGTEAASPAEV